MDNATSFGKQSAAYAKGRPGYPPELYTWIAENSSGHERVWDVGTGSGQAAHALVKYYDQVHATDISPEQIKAATAHPKIAYLTTPAHLSNLPSNSVDAVTIATALHWFATDRFWTEVSRVSRTDALFAAWTYQLPRSDSVAQTEFLEPVLEIIDPYWADGNRICMAGYTAEILSCPFPTLDTPEFDAGGIWTGQQIVNFAESWSAHYRARADGLKDALDNLSRNFLKTYKNEALAISLPISLLAARIRHKKSGSKSRP